ncbi:MAG: hypothetical protein ACKOWM_07910, partial [Sphingomonadales bacterium]
MKSLLLFFVLISVQATAQFQFNFTDFIPVVSDGQTLSKAWSGGLNNPQFSCLDYDFDGDDDLLVFDRSANQLRVFRHEVSGAAHSYKIDPRAHLFVPAELNYRVTTYDYDQDG